MTWLSREKHNNPSQLRNKRPVNIPSILDLERRTLEIGRNSSPAPASTKSSLFSAKFWSDQLLNWAMKDPAFKIQLFRFIDVFPMLNSPRMVHDYLLDYLSQPGVTLPPGMELGLKAGGLAKGLLAKTIAGRITSMASNFIAGTDAAAALPTLQNIWKQGGAFSVDLLGEACVSHSEARVYQQRYLDLVATLPDTVSKWPASPQLETDHIGPIPRTNVSIKISSLSARTDAIDFQGSLTALTEALKPILEAAARNNVFINFDMEQAALKDLTISLFEHCCEAVDFPAGLALQSYLQSGMDDARRIIAWARRTGRQITVRLIKGAYWDYEVINADKYGLACACMDRQTRNRRLFRAYGRTICPVHSAQFC